MKLKTYINQQKKTLIQTSKELGVPYEYVRRWSLGLVIPRPEQMSKIVTWSGGEVQPNDFYDLGEN